MGSPSVFEHFKTVVQLPFVVIVLIPSLIMYFLPEAKSAFWSELSPMSTIIGIACFFLGLALFIKSVDLFIKIGNGTLAPWNPTRKLIISSLYQFTRNPMLLGVNLILFGLALTLKSTYILIWNGIFLLINQIYFINSEEPKLIQKFGSEYTEYMNHVPRWIPRLSPWKPSHNKPI